MSEACFWVRDARAGLHNQRACPSAVSGSCPISRGNTPSQDSQEALNAEPRTSPPAEVGSLDFFNGDNSVSECCKTCCCCRDWLADIDDGEPPMAIASRSSALEMPSFGFATGANMSTLAAGRSRNSRRSSNSSQGEVETCKGGSGQSVGECSPTPAAICTPEANEEGEFSRGGARSKSEEPFTQECEEEGTPGVNASGSESPAVPTGPSERVPEESHSLAKARGSEGDHDAMRAESIAYSDTALVDEADHGASSSEESHKETEGQAEQQHPQTDSFLASTSAVTEGTLNGRGSGRLPEASVSESGSTSSSVPAAAGGDFGTSSSGWHHSGQVLSKFASQSGVYETPPAASLLDGDYVCVPEGSASEEDRKPLLCRGVDGVDGDTDTRPAKQARHGNGTGSSEGQH